MYEQSPSRVTPWPHRGWDVRQAWLDKARQELAEGGSAVERFPAWHEIKLLLRL